MRGLGGVFSSWMIDVAGIVEISRPVCRPSRRPKTSGVPEEVMAREWCWPPHMKITGSFRLLLREGTMVGTKTEARSSPALSAIPVAPKLFRPQE